jgi:signal transduction histidine kinase
LETGDAKLRAHINPVINGDGVIVGSVALLHDMSQTDAMNQVKADFMSMVSHELKAPPERSIDADIRGRRRPCRKYQRKTERPAG